MVKGFPPHLDIFLLIPGRGLPNEGLLAGQEEEKAQHLGRGRREVSQTLSLLRDSETSPRRPRETEVSGGLCVRDSAVLEAVGTDLIPGQGTKTPHAVGCNQNN